MISEKHTVTTALNKTNVSAWIAGIALEEARDNFSRYEFVHKLMPSLLSSRKDHRMFIRNLLIVALREDEAQKLLKDCPYPTIKLLKKKAKRAVIF